MTTEREHAHATPTETSAVDHDNVAPGRTTRSALLRKPDHAIASGLVQRKARDANGVAEGAEDAVAAASSSSGSPLPGGLMRKFESSLGADLSGVRVHTGETSAAANEAVGAKAYTLGNDIHFGAGHYDPSSPTGEHLLAHEVAHTVQQSGPAQRMQFKLAVSSPGDSFEHEADRAADAMVAGQAASVTFGSGVARKVMREAKGADANKTDGTMKFAQRSFPLGEHKLKEVDVSFLKLSLKAVADFEGSIAVKDGEEDVKYDGALWAFFSKTVSLDQLHFDPNGWFGLKELTMANFGVGKGTLAKATLFKGKVYRGDAVVGEVTVSVAAMDWDAKQNVEVKVFPVEVAGKLVLAQLDEQVDAGGGLVLGGGCKFSAGLKGSVAVDLQNIAKMAGGELAAGGTIMAGLSSLGTPLLTALAVGAVAVGGYEIFDDLDGDKVTKDALLEADRIGIGFENEMQEPGHSFKPSPFWKKDPYLQGIELASRTKETFFARFLADPRIAKWREAHPDQGSQMKQLDEAFRIWIKTDAGAQAALKMQAARLKSSAKQASLAEHFLGYANKFRLSGKTRVLRVFEALWPGAAWLDAARTMPVSFPQSVPKACYQVASEMDPFAYPADLKRWATPPTLV